MAEHVPDDWYGLGLMPCEGQVTIYFALPPPVTVKACHALEDVELPEGLRLVMEKPFGTDAESAASLNALLTDLVPEDRIHRVDHFLGLSTVINIVGLRFANRLLEPVLNSEHVASVEVVWDEDLGLEGRAGYYDWAGAMVDMIQSHLLQVVALMAMEAPSRMNAQDFRDSTAQILRATHVWDDDPAGFTRRARYTAGTLNGQELLSYADEEGIDPERGTETFAELVLAIDTWRWSGVPFKVRSGKGMSEQFIRERLFKPFQSTKAHGMGIGTFESREYIRELGGSLDVTSSEGKGTNFSMRLPVAVADVPA